ncbi:MAG: hypothetical protein U0807_16525 [Candidatus Binatia bacterium]
MLPPASSERRSRGRVVGVVAVLLLLGAAILLRLRYVHEGRIVYDEFQHVHPAFLMARGQTPYVDFFAHHPPLYYYLIAALIPFGAPTFDTMIHVRFLSLGVHLATIALIAAWVRAIRGRTEGLVVAALLLGNFFLFRFGTLGFLDTYALPLLVGAAWLVGAGRGRPLRCALGGAAYALAGLFTQKAIFAAIAHAVIFLGALPLGSWRRDGRRWLRDLAAYVAGGLATAALVALALGRETVVAFVRDAVLLNIGYKFHYFPRRELVILGASEAFVYATAAAGALATLIGLARRRLAVTPADGPALMLVAMALGIVLLPVCFEEYFILVVPFAVATAGMQMVAWWREHFLPASGSRAWRTCIAAAAIGAGVVDLVGLRVLAANKLTLTAMAVTVGLWGVLGGLLAIAGRRAPGLRAALCLALVLVLAVVQQVDWIPRNGNAEQRARVEYVLATTRPDEPFFDGRTGWGVFRPHAYRYWFLQEDFQPMLSREERGRDIVDALERTRAPLAADDEFVAILEPEVREYLATHYEDTPFPELKRRRDGVADPWAPRVP